MTATGRTAAGAIVVLIAVLHGVPVTAHSGLRFSSPLDQSALGASPTHVELTFIERPEPSLATIRVSDINGQTYHIGQPEVLASDPLTLTIAVRPLPKGVYLVNWRVVSAVDGHATAGAFAFGVQMAPTGPPPSAEARATDPLIEIAARTLFLVGLVVTLGAATYQLLGLGDAPWPRFAGIGTMIATVGLALLVVAQSRAGEAGPSALLGTAIGRAWMARAMAIVLAVIGVQLASFGMRSRRRAVIESGAVVVWLAACGAIIVHALSGHAAAGRWPVASTVSVHAIHVAAAGVWIGGLAILIADLRSSASRAEARGLARFSTLAAIGLVLVTITGFARSIQEVGAWQALATTTYGRLVIAKASLLMAIAVLGAMNRWRHLEVAGTDTRPLRRAARAEIGLAVLAIIAAGALATLPPPAAARALPGIEVSGADFATTVRATLNAVSDQPGPNRFTVAVKDFDSGEMLAADRVSLRFTPIDDPGVVATMLSLSKDAGGGFTGTGANVSFDGRWRVEVVIERRNNSVTVPLEIEARGRPQAPSVLRVPNERPIYNIAIGNLGSVQFIADREQPGDAHLQISCFTVFSEPLPIRGMVVTAAANGSPMQTLVISREDRHQFNAAIRLHRGTNRVVVIARTETDARLRATLELQIPDRD